MAPIVTASCSAGQARMSVQVADPAESIAFWLACSPHSESAGAGAQGATAASFAGCVPGTEENSA